MNESRIVNPLARNDLRRSLTEIEAAAYIGMSPSFLRQSRTNGDRVNRTPGPKYIKIGRAVRYFKEDLDAWLEAHRRAPLRQPNMPREAGDER